MGAGSDREPIDLPPDEEGANLLRTTWTNSTFGTKKEVVRTGVIRLVRPLLDKWEFTHIAEIGAGLCSTAEALRKAYGASYAVEGSDLEGGRLDEARKNYPDLAIHGEDAASVAERLKDRATVYVALNVLGNLPPDELGKFLRNVGASKSALIFVGRGLAPEHAETWKRRAKLGYDYNYRPILESFGLEFLSGTVTPREGDEGGAVYNCIYVAKSAVPRQAG